MKKITFLLTTLLFVNVVTAQVNIMNTSLNSLNITPHSLCQVSIMNGSGGEKQAVLEAKLMNNAGEVILAVKTMPFSLAVGLNSGLNLNFTMQSVQYGVSGQAEYIRTMHILPSGNFKYCISVVSFPENDGDDYCEDIVSDISSFLTLVYPNDKDTIDTYNPVLTWTHSEPFNILSPGDHFKIIVVELKEGQSAETGVMMNLPLYFKDYVPSHQVLYPYDAKELQQGKRYGWQVQKISNGTIIDKTEAWEFTIYNPFIKPDVKYVTLKKKNDGTYYTAVNDKIYFRFVENYIGEELDIRIYDSKRKELKPQVENDKNLSSSESNVKSTGANYFLLDLSTYHLKKGNYTLEVFNAKKEKYLLSFKVE